MRPVLTNLLGVSFVRNDVQILVHGNYLKGVLVDNGQWLPSLLGYCRECQYSLANVIICDDCYRPLNKLKSFFFFSKKSNNVAGLPRT
jgi:hypothetical protein